MSYPKTQLLATILTHIWLASFLLDIAKLVQLIRMGKYIQHKWVNPGRVHCRYIKGSIINAQLFTIGAKTELTYPLYLGCY